jgi:hypothetical protein
VFGGGAGGVIVATGAQGQTRSGANGACRVIWPGSTRRFPANGTADVGAPVASPPPPPPPVVVSSPPPPPPAVVSSPPPPPVVTASPPPPRAASPPPPPPVVVPSPPPPPVATPPPAAAAGSFQFQIGATLQVPADLIAGEGGTATLPGPPPPKAATVVRVDSEQHVHASSC